MYRQIIVAEEDVDFQRLVWRDSPESEMEEYRLEGVTFGTASAPYLAVKTLQRLAIDEGSAYPLVAEKVKKDYYVDDLLTGCQTVEEGKQIYKEMKELLSKVMEEHGNEEGKIKIKIDEIVKALGLTWDKQTDSFHYSVQLTLQENPITKRKVISDISRLFDPLGWVAPCVITAKVMIQKLWLSGIDWDKELPGDLLEEWLTYRSELAYI